MLEERKKFRTPAQSRGWQSRLNWKAILSLEDFQKDPEVPQVTIWRCELGEDALVGDQNLLGSSSAIQLGL